MARCINCKEPIERVANPDQPTTIADLVGFADQSAPWSSEANGTQCPDATDHQHKPMTKQDYSVALFDKEA